MHIGKQINTFSHASTWCLDKRNKVVIKSKSGDRYDQHGHGVIKSMPFGGLARLLIEGRLFELYD